MFATQNYQYLVEGQTGMLAGTQTDRQTDRPIPVYNRKRFLCEG